MILFLKKLFSFLLKAIGYLFFVIILLSIAEYFIAPIYTFKAPIPFKGEKIWNPYQSCDSGKWYKCNFHLHTKSWKGVTDGKLNSIDTVHSIYKHLGYDIIGFSNYQKITENLFKDEIYVPAYEHGFGIEKAHHVCIGANKVSWIDFPFFQTIHQRQYILNQLKNENDVVALAHPAFQRHFPIDEVKYLKNYNCIEVLNHNRISDKYWDTALSAGQPAYIVADDDAHNINNTAEVGHYYNKIFTDTLSREKITTTLKNGHAYGVAINIRANESYSQLASRVKKIAEIKKIKINENQLSVVISHPAKEFRFIGQNGKLLQVVENTDSAAYTIKKEDTYVRTEIVFSDSIKFYLNPVFKYQNQLPSLKDNIKIDVVKTALFRILLGFLIIFLIFIVIKFNRKKNDADGHAR